MGFFSKIKEFFSNMFLDKNDIKRVTGIPPQISGGMLAEIETWRNIYGNNPPWKQDQDLDKVTGFAKTVCRDIATKATVEAEIVTGNDEIDSYLKKTLSDGLTDKIERVLALGSAVVRPYYDVNKRVIAVSWYPADRVIPLQWEGENLVSVALLDFVTINENDTKTFIKVESHVWNGVSVDTITTKAYRWEGGKIANEVPLETVKEWEGITPEPVIVEGLKKPLFTYVKTPIANNIDGSSIGVSLFANCIDYLEELDKNFSSMAWERWAGDTRVYVADSMIPQRKTTDGKFIDDITALDKKLYRKMEGSFESGNKLFEVVTPSLRFESYINECNSIISMACKSMALDAKAFLVDRQGNPVTAEQILSEKNETYTTILALQEKMIIPALRGVLDNIRVLQILYSINPKLPENDKDISISFGDSVMTDEQTEKKMAMDEVTRGVRSKLSYLMEYRNMTEEEARKELEEIKADTPVIDYFGTGEGD